MMRHGIRGVVRAGMIVPTLSADEPMVELAPWHLLNAAGWLSTMTADMEVERLAQGIAHD